MDSSKEPKPEATTFQDVYRTEFNYVVHVLRRLGVKPADLEDVAHDVFVAVYRHFAERDPARPIKPWLFGFSFRIAKDHRKLARHRHEAPPTAVEPIDEGRLPDQQVDDDRLRAWLQAALDAMDFEKRGLVVMHDLEGIPVPTIAELLEVPLNTAYSRLRLARADFEKHLQRVSGGAHG